MQMSRRELLAGVATTAAIKAVGLQARGPIHETPAAAQQSQQIKLTIEPVSHEIALGVTIPTVGYNGSVPGPLLRLHEGRPVVVDVFNKTAIPELVHWHGLAIDPKNDGAMEEGSPMVPSHGHLRYQFTPRPTGSRWYHSHAMAKENLGAAGYSGQYGFLYVEPRQEAGAYDREVFLQVHHWDGSLVPMKMPASSDSDDAPKAPAPPAMDMFGCDIAYKHGTINGRKLGHGEPVRVKPGERVMFRMLNASATQNTTLALPGHSFTVVAMDGNPVPTPAKVDVLQLAVAERVDAIVEMNAPGVWTLGSIDDAERASGVGIVIEYAGSAGAPVWRAPQHATWDYSVFAKSGTAPEAEERFSMLTKIAAPAPGQTIGTWTINGESWPKIAPLKVQQGKRYRLAFVNSSPCAHPMHLHRHSFEVTRIGRKHMTGLMKDTINVPAGTLAEVDFIADNPGDSLLHCHQQMHMDYGFMQLIQYV